MKAYLTESQDIRDDLVLRGFLEGINHIQVMLDLRKQISDKDMKIATVLERALHLEVATRIEEEEQTTKVAIIRRYEKKDLEEAVTKLVNQLSVDDKQRENLFSETDLSKETNRLGGTTGKASSAEPVDSKGTFRGILEIVSYLEFPNT